MKPEVGKREAHKIATRRAIQDAADELFDARGYAETTVRDIADAAGVTERTFFRYFPGKEALLVDDVDEWLTDLGDQIRGRPSDETPLDAIENAVAEIGDRFRATTGPNPSWLFADGPPGPRLGRAAPGLLLRFEQVVADALTDRLRHTGSSTGDDVFTSQVVARCAVAALRSAGIRHWQLLQNEPPSGVAEADLVRQAFAIVRSGLSGPQSQ